MKHIAVIGAGSWGTALAIVAAESGHEVRLWSRNSDVVATISRSRINSVYLPDAQIPSDVRATSDIGEAVADAELVVIATPSHATRAILESMRAALAPAMILVSATKGIEVETGNVSRN